MNSTRFLAGLFALLALAQPAAAAPIVHAHPALWHVKGPKGDVTLMGSIHLLPPNVDWHTPAVKAAIAHADVFVFEVSTEAPSLDRLQALIAQRGQLPQGQTLRALLPPAARENFDAAMAKAHLPGSVVEREQPWLASLQLLVAQSANDNYSPQAGVDSAVMKEAAARHKPLRYFETIDQQFALLAPSDPQLQLREFEADLSDYAKSSADLNRLFDAWRRGDADALGRMTNEDLDPQAKKALLTDRNKRWALQIETMLEEKRRFFITVGAGHLSGPDGVPALLRKAGYTVTGP